MTMQIFDQIYDGKWDRNALDYLALIDQWHVVARSSDVSSEGLVPAKLLGERLVLWRSPDGEINVWNDYCAHRGAPLSLGKVKEGKLVCPYHGWHFDSHGKCTHVPAHPDQNPPGGKIVRRFLAKEKYGFVWVSIGTPVADLPRLPHWDDAEYRKVAAGPYRYQANALRCLDNFMDASHFPHVHPGVNGRGDKPDTTINYKIIEKDNELQTTDFTVIQPYADARGIELEVRYHYYCLSPTVAYSDKQTGPKEHWFTWCAMTPVDMDEAIFWLTMSFNYGMDIPEEKIFDRQAIVFGAQDRWIVEAQRPFSMPLDAADEMHVTSDRLGVAYRRWVKALGERKRAEIAGRGAKPVAA
ncbi:MAG: aromatic ring-hydroxylating dioxygenase subunit alpha [Rhodocyclaceae bacterium]|nr:aromatic ring-hydroxylating dioxygenase subunit alpha [Rhodocyclaceae bacterium]